MVEREKYTDLNANMAKPIFVPLLLNSFRPERFWKIADFDKWLMVSEYDHI